jgi:hypothetical protein
MIEELVGADKAASFWDTYYDKYVTESDIRKIAEEGLNSVRVPINSRFVLEDGDPVRYKEKHLALLDRVIDWCRKHRLYVILDLHGAPGGQTGTNIDDSEFDRPELFLDERNAKLTIELWKMLAARYKDEWIVAGYDLLNEPLPDWFAAYNDRIMPLYKEIVRAIREVDDRHMIILEGAHWSTDWSIFDEKIDDNVMLQFHKYWNNPDTESIQAYLDKREQWNVPIFMGEGGENNKDWYAGAFRLFEDHGISWNFWTWKKLERDNSPCSIRRPEGWGLLVDYLEGGAKPLPEVAEQALSEYLANIAFEQCAYYPEVVAALLRRPPVRIPAIFYGYGGAGISYSVSNRRTNSLGFRTNDGTDIRFVDSRRKSPNFQHGRGESWQSDERMCVQLAPGDWLAFDFNVQDREESSVSYKVDIRSCAVEGENGDGNKDGGRSATAISIKIEDRVSGLAEIGSEWNSVRLGEELRLAPGLHRIVLAAEGGCARIEWIEIKPMDDAN